MEKEYGYSPPFEITNEIIELVAQITELTGMIIVSEKLSSNPVLRRENRIKTIYSSLAIEQNTLSVFSTFVTIYQSFYQSKYQSFLSYF